jgi:hypothetical protein
LQAIHDARVDNEKQKAKREKEEEELNKMKEDRFGSKYPLIGFDKKYDGLNEKVNKLSYHLGNLGNYVFDNGTSFNKRLGELEYRNPGYDYVNEEDNEGILPPAEGSDSFPSHENRDDYLDIPSPKSRFDQQGAQTSSHPLVQTTNYPIIPYSAPSMLLSPVLTENYGHLPTNNDDDSSSEKSEKKDDEISYGDIYGSKSPTRAPTKAPITTESTFKSGFKYFENLMKKNPGEGLSNIKSNSIDAEAINKRLADEFSKTDLEHQELTREQKEINPYDRVYNHYLSLVKGDKRLRSATAVATLKTDLETQHGYSRAEVEKLPNNKKFLEQERKTAIAKGKFKV